MRAKISLSCVKLLIAFLFGFTIRSFMDIVPAESSCSECLCPSCSPFSRRTTTDHEEFGDFDSFETQIRESYKPKNVFDVLRYEYFTNKYAFGNYDSDPRIGLLGHQKNDLKTVIEDAMTLYLHTVGKQVHFKKMINAYRRFDPVRGEDIILDVILGERTSRFDASEKRHRFELVKPFKNLQLIDHAEIDLRKTIHFIVPVYNATERFQVFLQQFEKICLQTDFHCYLLVVLFKGDASSSLDVKQALDVNNLIVNLRKKYPKSRLRVVQTAKKFSRALALNLGVLQFPEDYLLFFCDVDLHVELEFLERCISNAALGKQVYYPTVFSQFEPTIVGQFSPNPRVVDLMDINKYTGHWIHYGYGMVCLHAKDYHTVGGFNLSRSGWGGEDVELYQKHIKSNFKVLRAMDPGLVHLYHAKSCDQVSLKNDEYRQCMDSRAEGIGSKTQLAKLLLTEQKLQC